MSNTRFSWINASVLTSTPIAAVVLATWYVLSQGFVWTDLVPFVAMYFLTGVGSFGSRRASTSCSRQASDSACPS